MSEILKTGVFANTEIPAPIDMTSINDMATGKFAVMNELSGNPDTSIKVDGQGNWSVEAKTQAEKTKKVTHALGEASALLTTDELMSR